MKTRRQEYLELLTKCTTQITLATTDYMYYDGLCFDCAYAKAQEVVPEYTILANFYIKYLELEQRCEELESELYGD
jgi:hypothetical protein